MIWDDSSRREFEQVVLRRGVRPVARALGCAEKSVYRWMDGEVEPDRRYQRQIADLVDFVTRNGSQRP